RRGQPHRVRFSTGDDDAPLVVDIHHPSTPRCHEGRLLMSTSTVELTKRPLTPSRVLLHVFLLGMALLWLFPMLWALFNSFRDYGFTMANGYFSFGGFTLDNYVNAWDRGGFSLTFLNS